MTGGLVMDFWETVEGRRSIRDFTSQPVAEASLERIIRAASMAPSALNSQPWTFHVCVGDSRLALGELVAQATVHLGEYVDVLGPEKYETTYRWYSSLGDAPVAVVIAMPVPNDEIDALNVPLSVGAALENMLLASYAEGLGACSVTMGWWVRDELRELLGIPSDQTIASIVVIGHSSELPPAAPDRREDVAVWHE